jgi:hypothetical protein
VAGWPSPGLMNLDVFLRHVGQLRVQSYDVYGQPTASSVNTVACLVYTEENPETDSTPARVGRCRHFLVIPSSVTVHANYHISNVVDPNGNVVLADARITDVMNFNHWRFGERIKVLHLELPTNPV